MVKRRQSIESSREIGTRGDRKRQTYHGYILSFEDNAQNDSQLPAKASLHEPLSVALSHMTATHHIYPGHGTKLLLQRALAQLQPPG